MHQVQPPRLLAALFAALALLSSCNCSGTVDVPCAQSSECGPGMLCRAGKCLLADGGTGGTGGSGGGGGTGGGGGSCTGLQCQQQPCENSPKTRVTGTVFAPNGTLPLFNATVYVPNEPLTSFTTGVSCDKCGAGLSGSPIVKTTSGADGTFVLDNVPAGANIPLVIQMGRWRRQVTLPQVTACTTNPVTDANLTRLPRTKAEGDIPQMAIATGDADPFECLLRKIGIADSEFTPPTGSGRVHYYCLNGINLSPPAPGGSQLHSSLTTLKRYDMVMLPCEGAEYAKPAASTQNIIDYANLGGRVFATHYSYVWIAGAQPPFPGTGTWNLDQAFPVSPKTYTLDTSFPKGSSFADWLVNVNASTTRGSLSIIESRHDLDAIDSKVAQRWFYGTNSVQHYTFNTPVAPLLPDGGAPDQCGRVLFSDFHVSASALSGLPTFPSSCRSDALTAQEKALAFMLFDLSNCVQRDEIGPIIN